MAPPPLKIPPAKYTRYALETTAAYLVYGFFRILPVKAASFIGGCILRAIGPRMGVSRIAEKNIARAFPEKTAAERRDIMIGMWDNLGRVIAEYPHLRRLWRNVELVGGKYITEALDKKSAAIFFGGHLGNWEVPPIAAHKAGLDLSLVYRKPNNPWVDGLLRHARRAGAAGHIGKGHGGAREIVSILKNGGAVGMLVDQKLNEGLPVPFFGHDAMTAPAIAQFALKFKCSLYPIRAERLAGAKFRMTVFPPLAVTQTGNNAEDIRRILTDINRLLEEWIRKNPAQWLWIHRRWPD